MKTSVLRALGAAIILGTAMSACASPAEPQASTPPSSAPPASESLKTGSTPPATTPAPTPTPEAKAYTSTELAGILQQLEDSEGRKLSVLAGNDLTDILDQTRALIAAIEVSPAECKELALSSTVPPVGNPAMALGQSTDPATGAATAVSLASGLDEAALAGVANQPLQLGQCANMTMKSSGVDVAVSITPLDGVGGMSNTVAYRTDTQLPDGRVQSVITAQAVERGVLLSAVASGGESEADAAWRAGALLDTAAALVK
ncbi:hypothetical protein [Arthrobacter sp. OV608]|uniref:hypothetical protein n=1 Tax=Arthrobacter sp. OV608 TaxID=1882768 RepID=UPI0008AD2AC7|nr:hypothetical protein [Arthrobacter sp. OV608]SEQ14215.1 hypothetical protein SAMN05444745_104100 [Arthrobacter sp. OV608]